MSTKAFSRFSADYFAPPFVRHTSKLHCIESVSSHGVTIKTVSRLRFSVMYYNYNSMLPNSMNLLLGA